MSIEELMALAIEKARAGVAQGQSPFGCAIALEDRVLAVSHNTVWKSGDITRHAEMNAVSEACRELGSIFLEGARVATTCEPCPMCMAGLHWARVQDVHFGATIPDAAEAGFNELDLRAARLLEEGKSTVRLHSGLLRLECQELFQEWKARGNKEY